MLVRTNHTSGVGLWVMSGVVGLMTTVGVLLIHQRSLVSPWLLLGVLPTAVSAFFVF
jgi:multisubunit Na+/H+ antiporter MnhC subunit